MLPRDPQALSVTRLSDRLLGNVSSSLLAAEATEECAKGLLKNNGDIYPKLKALMHAYLPPFASRDEEGTAKRGW